MGSARNDMNKQAYLEFFTDPIFGHWCFLGYNRNYTGLFLIAMKKTPLQRNIEKIIIKDLSEKMILLAGPRQCGKTTLAKKLLNEYKGTYYSWDADEHRKLIRSNKIDEASKLWVFDELHKFKSWRNWLKGLYDLHSSNHKILVTGSAMLDVYSRGGDSLQGRYYFHRLHPFTLSEYLKTPVIKNINKIPELPTPSNSSVKDALNDLLELGGFPEPLFSGSQKKAARWRLSYGARLIREDIRSLEIITDLDRMELLFDQLPKTVGSILSLNSLREDLEISFDIVKRWLNIFEKNYVCFRIAPFGAPKIRAVKKESKLYFWDWGYVEEKSHRLENLVAMHLLRFVHWCHDVEGERIELRYFRDTRGHEIDFILLRKNIPWIAIEVKQSEQDLSPNLKYLLERIKIPYAFQIHLKGNNDFRVQDINSSKIRVLPVWKFLINLP